MVGGPESVHDVLPPHGVTEASLIWRTPLGHHYLVDHRGTHAMDPEEGAMLFDAPPGVELYFADLTLAT